MARDRDSSRHRPAGRALKGRRDRVVLATKFGQTNRPGEPNGVDGRPAHIQAAREVSLKRLSAPPCRPVRRRVRAIRPVG
jgi:hypothetical protein